MSRHKCRTECKCGGEKFDHGVYILIKTPTFVFVLSIFWVRIQLQLGYAENSKRWSAPAQTPYSETYYINFLSDLYCITLIFSTPLSLFYHVYFGLRYFKSIKSLAGYYYIVLFCIMKSDFNIVYIKHHNKCLRFLNLVPAS